MNTLDASLPSNLTSLADYRAKRESAARASRPAPSYWLWYPGSGYVARNVAHPRVVAATTQRGKSRI
jgi:hypothetical protein